MPPEVDLRVLQANERTLLAWIRTDLALLGFGFVVARFGVFAEQGQPLAHSRAALAVGVLFVLLGTVSSVAATLRYVRIRRAILEARPIVPGIVLSTVIALSIALLGLLLLFYLLTR